ncbi:hypothetical protein [Bacillus sp. KH172YL63]|uniref:hypothetical protein n=1 Tax=Bacillus sp. KH172YL63 TaxID=2709784 RepID=UPI0013E46E33|nr:hypothetical protein [Bacillus sp. KH172YL63]BCB04758.1 hypothetical protein KH172YL63_28910 [Bacillus sp. KH172YL63]
MRLTFGDILINHYAGDKNPLKVGVFIKLKKRTVYMTDMKGRFWEQYSEALDNGNLEKVGNVLDKSKKKLSEYLKNK